MTCRQVPTYNGAPGSGNPAGGGYATEADCLNACKEGACCEGATCSVKAKCQCRGTGQKFQGLGTTCDPNPCLCPTPDTGGVCCMFGQPAMWNGYWPGVVGGTRATCEAAGGTWFPPFGPFCTGYSNDCKTGFDCKYEPCRNPLP